MGGKWSSILLRNPGKLRVVLYPQWLRELGVNNQQPVLENGSLGCGCPAALWVVGRALGHRYRSSSWKMARAHGWVTGSICYRCHLSKTWRRWRSEPYNIWGETTAGRVRVHTETFRLTCAHSCIQVNIVMLPLEHLRAFSLRPAFSDPLEKRWSSWS